MNWKALSLRLHRWLALALAAPLRLIILSGLLLSAEPLLQRAWMPAPLSQDVLLRHLGRHDPQGATIGLTVRPYEATLLISGAGPNGEVEVDLRAGEEVMEDGPWSLPELFRTARQMHEHLLLDQYWIVTASTVGMLLLAVNGIATGVGPGCAIRLADGMRRAPGSCCPWRYWCRSQASRCPSASRSPARRRASRRNGCS
ncbi:MAG: PepSY domain-containing protein [Hyphomicrobiales bacterium]|nr:PepSY domain-containing protein [Hyphomicrobiales bacterium]